MICLRKKRKKWISWFFGWKLGGFDIFRGQFLKIFKKNPKNLTSPVNIKCFNLKNHHQLKKKILSTKKWRQIYSSSGPTGPPPGTQRVNIILASVKVLVHNATMRNGAKKKIWIFSNFPLKNYTFFFWIWILYDKCVRLRYIMLI